MKSAAVLFRRFRDLGAFIALVMVLCLGCQAVGIATRSNAPGSVSHQLRTPVSSLRFVWDKGIFEDDASCAFSAAVWPPIKNLKLAVDSTAVPKPGEISWGDFFGPQVPLKEALDRICRANALAYAVIDGVIYVSKPETVARIPRGSREVKTLDSFEAVRVHLDSQQPGGRQDPEDDASWETSYESLSNLTSCGGVLVEVSKRTVEEREDTRIPWPPRNFTHRQCLDWVCRLHGLVYCIRGRRICVDTPERLVVVRSYDVSELSKYMRGEVLVELVRGLVGPESWDESAPGSAPADGVEDSAGMYFSRWLRDGGNNILFTRGVVYVSQTVHCQEKIGGFYDGLKKFVREYRVGPVVERYDTSGLVAHNKVQDLIRAIRTNVRPGTWANSDIGGAFVKEIVPELIIVFHVPEVQKEVAEFLARMRHEAPRPVR